MTNTRQRSFLFLQGPLSPLYRRLAEALECDGHTVCRVNLCFGDWLDWWRTGGRRNGGLNYRGRASDWPAFVRGLLQDRSITDIILHGDQRPYHKVAADAARAAGVRVIVTELGYLRPDWMTLERNGTNAASHFPRNPEAIRRLAAGVPAPDLTRRYDARFFNVAAPDVVYNLSSTLLWFLYPHFRRHTIYFPPMEYLAWIGRLLTARRRDLQARAIAKRIIAQKQPIFVVPLQLEGDFQIRVHSPFASQTEGLAHIISSFGRHAPRDSHLLLKSHPLDNGLERWRAIIARIADTQGAARRVHFLDGGSLSELWPATCGVVTINSSAGLEALLAHVPVKTLGPAIYDVPGLTHQEPLDTFWTARQQPHASLLNDFVRALAGTVQVRGTLYSRDGLDAAVANMAARILADDFLTPETLTKQPASKPCAA